MTIEPKKVGRIFRNGEYVGYIVYFADEPNIQYVFWNSKRWMDL